MSKHTTNIVVYFDQLWGAARTPKMVETLFWPFTTNFVDLRCLGKPAVVAEWSKTLSRSLEAL